ncbi:hypothetical protein M426DRAFT_8901 [Hypoxylon sp. CI-4A]|nr:hypothetical protein M426DRAFT_8901 [Hypoxylon sp. CI-4A]
MSLTDLSGWAIRRNGSCLGGKEVDCGATLAPFRACCPSSTECPSQYNVACCPSGTNCTTAIVEAPRCANSSWSMFDNGGYFCCEEGQVGYDKSNTNGCSRSGASLPDGTVPLAVISQSERSTSTTSSTSESTSTSTSSATSSPTSSSLSDSSSHSSAGAIAGGVVGGIALIAIILAALFFFRKRNKNRDVKERLELLNQNHNQSHNEKDTVYMPVQSEIGGTPRSEMPGETPPRIYELSSGEVAGNANDKYRM